jgi:hypothetical protein
MLKKPRGMKNILLGKFTGILAKFLSASLLHVSDATRAEKSDG